MRTMLTAVALGLMVLAGSVAYAGSSPARKCIDTKAKEAGKKAASLLKAMGKNISKNPDTKLAANISKAESKFTKGFSKAESKGGCDTIGDAVDIEAKINKFVADAVGICPCCEAAPAAFAFETTAGSGTCGTLRNFRCNRQNGDFDFVFHACVDDGDCDFGLCSALPFCNPPGKCCAGDFNISCVTDIDCGGTCREQLKCNPGGDLCSTDSDCPQWTCDSKKCSGSGQPCVVDSDCSATETCGGMCTVSGQLCTNDGDCLGECGASGGLPQDLDCGSLYSGGGLNTVPLPLAVPDKGISVAAVTDCTNNTLTLGPTTEAAIGTKRNCTEGKKCSVSDTSCVVDSDCPGTEICEDRCFFGAPLPVPNATNAPTSVCVVNVISEDTTGTVDCSIGSSDVRTPLAASIFVTGDTMNASNPPDVPGIQPCPLCTRVCTNGTNNGFPCTTDGDCTGGGTCGTATQCVGGINNGNICTPETSRLDVHECCSGGTESLRRCGSSGSSTCPGGGTCVQGCTSFPTSLDCLPLPGGEITGAIGGLPIDFTLTTGMATTIGPDNDLQNEGERVFCGFCRDQTSFGTLCFEGNPSTACPVAGNGLATPCTTNLDCSPPYESCQQRSAGAFSFAAATQYESSGSTDGECMADFGCHPTVATSHFCIAPTFDAAIDAAGDLPGPGLSNFIGFQQIGTSVSALVPPHGSGICAP